MYATIEAEIDNGWIKGPESRKLPAHAHVLITLLSGAKVKRPEFGTRTSEKIIAAPDAFQSLSKSELSE